MSETARRTRVAVALAAAALLGTATTAEAASYSGSRSDPQDQSPGQMDLQQFTVQYDSGLGEVRANYLTYPYVSDGNESEFDGGLRYRFGLSRVGQGGCANPPVEPDVNFLMFNSEGPGLTGTATLHPRLGFGSSVTVNLIREEGLVFRGDPLTAGFLAPAGALRCVTRIFMSRKGAVEDGDAATGFCMRPGGGQDALAACGPPLPPDPPKPADPRPPVAVTPDPEAAGQQPPATSTSPTVVVVTIPSTSPSNPDGTGTGTVSDGQRSLTSDVARRLTSSVLRKRFKSEYTNRRGFKVSCVRVSSKVRKCSVSWKARRFSYRGTVRVTLTPPSELHYRFHIIRTLR